MIIPLLDVTLQGLPDWSLSERDVDVLSFLGDEEFRYFTFEGLKRRLGLHPETLSRILDRLEEEGIVRKSVEGYAVTRDIARQLRHHPANSENSRLVLLQTYLPSDLSVETLISNLRGRWFGLLRWLGQSGNAEVTTLKWVTEDGDIQVEAKITLNALSIEAKFVRGYDQNLALKAAYQLMAHIGRLSIRTRTPTAQHVGYFGNSNFYFMPT